MVQGYEELRRLAVFDFDGTLIRGNSLHEYVKAAAGVALRRRRYGRALALAWWAALRVCRLVSHNTMKRRQLAIIEPDDELRREFERRIAGMWNDRIVAEMNELRSRGYDILLATAAPEVYLPWVWDGAYVCTDNAVSDDCRGERKLQRVREYAESHGCFIAFAAADGPDDAPLIAAAAESIHL